MAGPRRMTGTEPVIRVVAIARDEAAAIGGFLAQFLPATRDFCVLDTGSTDGTPDLARAAGARVESAPFEDFAAARNEALARFAAGADWILMLDPDERLDAHTIAHLGALVAHPAHDILLAPLAALHADGSRRAWPGKPFLFRADAGLRWVFKVHEKLVGSTRQAIVANARIDHALALHDAPRRAAAERRYEALAGQEPYFVDAAYRQRMRDAWPILDYDRAHDDRLGCVVAGPLVSVVIPTYRRPELLQRAVRSALAQDYPNLEVLVVGDHDPCHAEYAGAFASDPRVSVHDLPRNHGPGGAVPRNHALGLARGDLVAYLDDDNTWAPDHLSSLYEAMRAADAAFAFSSMQVDGTDLRFRRPEFQGIDTSCLLHRKALLARYGDWVDNATAGYHHDWELVSRWVDGGERWACTGRATLHYNPATSRQREFILGLAAQRAQELGAAGTVVDAGGAAHRRPGEGPLLCLNMIVKNEAAIIERLLRSVAGVVACCVVCDTGSTDGTPQVIAAFCAARGIACELHAFPFVDFGQARNEALDRARRSPLGFDYLLLADADMELCIDAPDALAALHADAALLRQENATIAYDNVRLLRRGASARYVGATHEALVVDGDVVSLPGWRFVDHADGANRPEKLARDERLLRAVLRRDPGDARAMFYLAQTLQDSGQHQEAAAWYERRVAAAGWDEERWYARYRHAQCLLALGDAPGFVAGCLDAYALRPTRAEPLWRLAGHYAERGQRDAALLLYEQVARMPRPEADRLFLERDAYGDAAAEAISIHGWYSALPARREAGRRACEALAVSAAAAPQRRAAARRNLFFYAQPLASLCSGTRVAAIDFPLPAPWRATNPSFTRDGDGFAGVVRAVNYRIVDGSYDVRDDHGVVRTRNFLVRLAPDLTVTEWREMRDLAPLPRIEAGRVRGFEDCRLFRWRDAWWCTATARDVVADQRAVMVLLRLDAAGDIVAAHPLRGYGDDLHQKNWMPLVGDRLRFVYSLGPTLVLDASAGDGSFIVESGVDPGLAVEHWRGGGPLVPWDAGHLALVHEANDTPQGREYVHRFVALDDCCVPLAATAAFHFHARGIEFAAGLTLDGDALVASYGVGDGSAWVARVPCAAVRDRLQPLSR